MKILSVFVWSITSKKSRLFVICVVAPESMNHSFVDSPMYLLKLYPHVLRTCVVADVNKLVVFNTINSQRYRTLSFFVFSLPIVRDRIRCVALHYRQCVLTNQQHLYFKLPNLVV